MQGTSRMRMAGQACVAVQAQKLPAGPAAYLCPATAGLQSQESHLHKEDQEAGGSKNIRTNEAEPQKTAGMEMDGRQATILHRLAAGNASPMSGNAMPASQLCPQVQTCVRLPANVVIQTTATRIMPEYIVQLNCCCCE